MIRLLFPAICLIALWVPFYNRIQPTLFGIPFFYWSQVVLVIIGAILTWIVYAVELKKTPQETDQKQDKEPVRKAAGQ